MGHRDPRLDFYREDLADNLGVVRVGTRGGLPRGFKQPMYRFDEELLTAQKDRLLRKGARLAAGLGADDLPPAPPHMRQLPRRTSLRLGWLEPLASLQKGRRRVSAGVEEEAGDNV